MLNFGHRRLILKTCYRLLELKPPVTVHDIRAAYRRLAARNHPDRLPPSARDLKKRAHQQIAELGLAKQYLLEQLFPQKAASLTVSPLTSLGKAAPPGTPVTQGPKAASTEVGRTRALSKMLLDTTRRQQARVAADLHISAALTDMGSDRFGAAQRKLKKAAQYVPQDPEIYLIWAHSLGQQGQTEAALEKCNQAISISAANPDTYVCRGDLFLSKGRPKDAVADYNRALKNDPACVSAHRSRATAFVSLGQYQKAVQDLSRAIELERPTNFVYDRLGTTRSDFP